MATDPSVLSLHPGRGKKDRTEIEALILYLLQNQGPLTKTRLSLRTEVNSDSVEAALNDLQEQGMISTSTETFDITDKGKQYLEAYIRMRDIRFSSEKQSGASGAQ